MKTHRTIFTAFMLNLAFSVLELFGGLWTGSVAILSDALHDLGDALSIGISFFLEKKSTRPPDETYTYGYGRYSVLGSIVTSTVLLLGSAAVIYNAITRLIAPKPVNYQGMILFAVIGTVVNLVAAILTREGASLNQRAVNLHMLEDVLGWITVLVGAVIMHFTGFSLLDPILSICVAVFIIINGAKNLKEAAVLFLAKAPGGLSPQLVRSELLQIPGVTDVHHIHLWSMDGSWNLATMHIVTDLDHLEAKAAVREALQHMGIAHATLELEGSEEVCTMSVCRMEQPHSHCHHHHHHHHH